MIIKKQKIIIIILMIIIIIIIIPGVDDATGGLDTGVRVSRNRVVSD